MFHTKGPKQMENLVFTQLSIPEVKQLFREELENFFAEKRINEPKSESDEIGGIDLAIELTGLAKPTIYGLVSDSKIPVMKRGKKLYFSRREILDWLKQGRRKTQSEIQAEAIEFATKRKSGISASPRK